MKPLNVIIATLVGISLFLLDLKFGTLSIIFGGFPSVIVIAIITGIIAGDILDGVLACALYEVLGLTLVVFLYPFLFPEWGPLSADIFTRFLVVMMLAIEHSLDLSPWPWILFPLIIALLSIIAPLIFGIALMLSVLGGLIGRWIHGKVLGRDYSKPKPVEQQQPAQEGVLE